MTVKRRIAKNKHKTGQRINTKKLLKYKNELEDCVQSQQKTIEELQSEIANNALAYQIKDKRYNDMLKYCELNRPEILQLMKTFAKQGVLAAQGKVQPIEVKLMKAKRKAPRIPDAPNFEVKEPTLEEAKALRDQFYEQFPEVKKVLESFPPSLPQTLEMGPPHPINTDNLKEVWNPKTRKFEKEKP